MQHDKDKDANVTMGSANPRWWDADHTSAWTRIKEALRRDWEQTKHDFSKKSGQELHQNVGDTVEQMAGKEPVGGDWSTVEPAMRFGYGVKRQRGTRSHTPTIGAGARPSRSQGVGAGRACASAAFPPWRGCHPMNSRPLSIRTGRVTTGSE